MADQSADRINVTCDDDVLTLEVIAGIAYLSVELTPRLARALAARLIEGASAIELENQAC